MKKIVSILLAIVMMLAVLPTVSLYAITDELLVNGDFEEGDETGWAVYGKNSAMEVTEEAAHSGEYGMILTDRQDRHATYAQDISRILTVNGPGEYTASFWARLPEGSSSTADCYLVINIQSSTDSKPKYYVSEMKPLTNEWQQFTFTGKIDFKPELGFTTALIYPQYYINSEAPDILFDDVSLKKISEVNGIPIEEDISENFEMTQINVDGNTREEETTFGVIRWDAWYSHDGNPTSVVSQVEKTLSPAEYHWRAPFFAEITKEGKIEMPKYTQEIFDKEMEYAIEAGIDYFAYLWYDGAMGTARKMHKSSKYKNDVKFSICLDGNGIGNQTARDEILKLFKEDHYMTVLDGRPLMYYYVNTSAKQSNMNAVAKEIKYYRAHCVENGIKEPFVVVMNVSGTEATSIYGDAVSNYSFSGTNDMTFKDFIAKVQSYLKQHHDSATQYVPAMTFGWHAEPRYKNPVSWMSVNENSWVPYPTDEEMYDHVMYYLSYMDHDSAKLLTKANTLIFYAWNEHDEGSWLCPTIAVDENGNQLYNEDGSKKINDSRIQILKKAISDYKAGKRTAVTINGITSNASDLAPSTTDSATATPTPVNTASTVGTATSATKPNDKNNTSIGTVIGIGLAGIIVVIAGTIIAIIVIKKNVKKEE